MKVNISKPAAAIRCVMPIVIWVAVLILPAYLRAQDDNAYVCTSGKIHFFSPSVTGDVDATSHSAICVVNTKTKKVYSKVQETSFSFKEKLMQSHFNENYMESDKYPYAILDMVIVDNITFGKDGTFDITLKGTIEMHGVKLTREIKGKLVIKNGQPLSATATFIIKPSDHKVKIPSILGDHIADSVKVDVEFNFEKYKRS